MQAAKLEPFGHACLLSLTCCRERLPALLSKLRLQHGAVEVHGTPRRLAVLVHDLAAAQTPQESKVRTIQFGSLICGFIFLYIG